MISQRGVAMLMVLIVMGFLAALMVNQIRQTGFVALSLQRSMQESRLAQQAELIALTLQQLPLRVSELEALGNAWQPMMGEAVSACGADTDADYAHQDCASQTWQWHWRLLKASDVATHGEDATESLWPLQHWQLQIRVRRGNDTRQWRYHFAQRVLP